MLCRSEHLGQRYFECYVQVGSSGRGILNVIYKWAHQAEVFLKLFTSGHLRKKYFECFVEVGTTVRGIFIVMYK